MTDIALSRPTKRPRVEIKIKSLKRQFDDVSKDNNIQSYKSNISISEYIPAPYINDNYINVDQEVVIDVDFIISEAIKDASNDGELDAIWDAGYDSQCDNDLTDRNRSYCSDPLYNRSEHNKKEVDVYDEYYRKCYIDTYNHTYKKHMDKATHNLNYSYIH
jgi:hypothetical protein